MVALVATLVFSTVTIIILLELGIKQKEFTIHVAKQSIVADLGTMHIPDLAAEMADLLIRLDKARAVLCLGTHEQTLHLSIRTEPLGQDAGLLVQQVIVPEDAAVDLCRGQARRGRRFWPSRRAVRRPGGCGRSGSRRPGSRTVRHQTVRIPLHTSS